MHLRGDHDFFTASEVLERPADNLLARAVGIDVSGIEERDAEFQRPLDERAALLLIKRPGMVASIRRSVRHAAETQARNLKARVAKPYIVHHFHLPEFVSVSPDRPLSQ